MATTQGNRTTQAFGVEASPNTEPSITYYLSPNSFGAFGPRPERIARDPIGPSIMAEPGSVIRTMADANFAGDFVRDNWRPFLDGALRCAWSTTPRRFYPTSVRSTDFVVAANGALVEGTLVYVRGCAVTANNGLKVVGSGSDGTHIVCSGLTAETFTSGQGVTVEVCGFQFTAGDAEIDASGYLKTTTKDLTDFGIPAGQMIWIGGDTTATKFATAAHRGQARVAIAPTAHLITLENVTSGTFPAAAADTGSGKTIQLFYGQTLRVVPTTDARYTEQTYQVEYGHGTLSAGSAAYEYITGCAVTNYAIALPTANKATLTIGFDGQGHVATTASRRSGFAAPLRQNAKAMLNTADHIKRGRLRQAGTDLTGYITSVDLTIATGATRNEAHGAQNSILTTYGDVVISGTVNAFFSSMDLLGALVADTLCNADWLVRAAGDGWGVAFDVTGLQLTGAPRQIDPSKPTGVAIAFQAVVDATFGTIMIVSDFPYLPA